MLENFVAPYDAHVVALLNQAGMVTLGETNMDEFARVHLMNPATLAQ